MLQPHELKVELPVKLSNDVVTTTTQVWKTLEASYKGDLDAVKQHVSQLPALIYAQYNYTPPIHFAVREGHLPLVEYLLQHGAHDPSYKIYPFKEPLTTFADDRGYMQIYKLLTDYSKNEDLHKYKGDNGEILYQRNKTETEFQQAVDKNNIEQTRIILQNNPGFASDHTYFWGEGIMTMPAKKGNFEMLELLLSYGATVPPVLKWAQFYYFEREDVMKFLLENDVDANLKSWHHVTILHDMAEKGMLTKAMLLLKHGANVNAIDEEYRSTPLGMAARWGHADMVKLLLDHGADRHQAGAVWSTPIEWARRKGFLNVVKLLQ